MDGWVLYMKRRSIAILSVLLLMVLEACGTSGQEIKENITITSDDLKDGIWDEVITNTAYGRDQSPQLSWNTIEGAGCYAVIMIDPDGNNWLHWMETDIRENEIQQGYSSPEKYIGPYPPSGTHHYHVYVYALKEPVSITSAKFDHGGNDIGTIEKELSQGGNCLGYGMTEGTYTSGN